MVWKLSTDMKTVLVPSEGHLNAATGFVVYPVSSNRRPEITTDLSKPSKPKSPTTGSS